MSQVTTPLIINDGAATPVAKTFTPERVSPELTSFAEKSATSSAGFKRITISCSPASSKRGTNRIDVSLDLPVLATVNGVTTVAHTGRFKGYFVIPDAMVSADRADMHAFVTNAFADSIIRNAVKALDFPY